MNTKLTLKMNAQVIERAKKLAAKKSISLSRMIEAYLDSITEPRSEEMERSPYVKSITNGRKISADLDSFI